jgi:hypothetical protein
MGGCVFGMSWCQYQIALIVRRTCKLLWIRPNGSPDGNGVHGQKCAFGGATGGLGHYLDAPPGGQDRKE